MEDMLQYVKHYTAVLLVKTGTFGYEFSLVYLATRMGFSKETLSPSFCLNPRTFRGFNLFVKNFILGGINMLLQHLRAG